MSVKYPKNIIIVFSVVAALMAATVLLGGYTGGQPANSEKQGCCPVTGQTGTCAKTAALQAETSGCTKTPCGEEKPEGCDKPCGEECDKQCCAEKIAEGSCPATAEKTGCCPVEAAAQ